VNHSLIAAAQNKPKISAAYGIIKRAQMWPSVPDQRPGATER
jgi:hypothetical protein